MRFSVIVLALLVAAASAQLRQPYPRILEHTLTRDANGQAFQLRFLTENRISHTDQGTLKSAPEGLVLVRQGESSYVDPNGETHTLRFTADENGYHPVLN
ncbi:Larval cuticle protein 16/17 [Frankliniella fusca]|uniref:Larval cuticle protein 16/17 n=1 Tax=Frankliniella fusca TaxID=407009 RepID=A0AAE1HU19_9NEOP|nr:Larval cuticle protein 16/17 [Frankliniella fusca]